MTHINSGLVLDVHYNTINIHYNQDKMYAFNHIYYLKPPCSSDTNLNIKIHFAKPEIENQDSHDSNTKNNYEKTENFQTHTKTSNY